MFIFLQKTGFNGIIKGCWLTNSNDHYFVFLSKLKMTSKSHKWLIYISCLTIIVDLDILSDHLEFNQVFVLIDPDVLMRNLKQ